MQTGDCRGRSEDIPDAAQFNSWAAEYTALKAKGTSMSMSRIVSAVSLKSAQEASISSVSSAELPKVPAELPKDSAASSLEEAELEAELSVIESALSAASEGMLVHITATIA